jgi:hypothetical protein
MPRGSRPCRANGESLPPANLRSATDASCGRIQRRFGRTGSAKRYTGRTGHIGRTFPGELSKPEQRGKNEPALPYLSNPAVSSDSGSLTGQRGKTAGLSETSRRALAGLVMKIAVFSTKALLVAPPGRSLRTPTRTPTGRHKREKRSTGRHGRHGRHFPGELFEPKTPPRILMPARAAGCRKRRATRRFAAGRTVPWG